MEAIGQTTESIIWHIDPVHSRIEFVVEHMVISHITGQFRKFEGKVVTEGEEFENAQIEIQIEAASIDTNNEQRDAHLRSADFIYAEKYPVISFKSTSVRKTGERSYIVTGDFTLRGIVKTIEFNARYNGSVKDPYNNTRAGFKVQTEINRRDYSVNWRAFLETGGLVVGDTIEITGFIEIVHEA